MHIIDSYAIDPRVLSDNVCFQVPVWLVDTVAVVPVARRPVIVMKHVIMNII